MISNIPSLAILGLSLFAPKLVSAATTASAAATCNRDNCLRSIITQSSASADCSAYQRVTVTPCPVTTTVTGTTGASTPTTTLTTQTQSVATEMTFTTTTITVTAGTVTGTGTEVSTVTPTTTVTVIGTPTAVVNTLRKRQVCSATTVRGGPAPSYAATCASPLPGTATVDRYSSACACIGISGSTMTLPASTITVTGTVTTTTPAAATVTSTSTITTTVTVPVTVSSATTTTPTGTATSSVITTETTATVTVTSTYTGPFNVALVSGASTVGYVAATTQAQKFAFATDVAQAGSFSISQLGSSAFGLTDSAGTIGFVPVLGNNDPTTGDFLTLGSLETVPQPQGAASGTSVGRFTGSPYETTVFELVDNTGDLSVNWFTSATDSTRLVGFYIDRYSGGKLLGAANPNNGIISGGQVLVTYKLVIPTSD